MTLLYPMQLLDEIPMLWGSCLLIYGNYDLISLINKQTKMTKIYKYLVLFLDVGFVLIATYVYIYYLTNPVFHEICYGLQVLVIVIENVYIIKKLNLSPRLYALSFGYYLFGFLLWNIDNQMCSHLKGLRHRIDFYIEIFYNQSTKTMIFSSIVLKIVNLILIILKSFTELHAMWHLFTGYGAYLTNLCLLDAFYENLIIKRLNKLSTTDSFKSLDNDFKQKMEFKSKKSRPVITKLLNIIYGLNNDFVNSKIKNY